MIFKIKLADQIIEIESLYDTVGQMCLPYRVSEEHEASIHVKVTQSDIDYEQRKSDEAYYSPAYLETLAVYRQIATQMVGFDTMLMHGTAFAMDGRACIVTAPSGTGKTTFLKTLLKLEDPRETVIVNGDKPLLHVDKARGQVVVYGTPWSGKEKLNTNCCAPLAMICILRRGDVNDLREISFSEALSVLMSQTYRPEDTALYMKTIALIGAMKDKVKFYELHMKRYEDKKDIESVAAGLVAARL